MGSNSKGGTSYAELEAAYGAYSWFGLAEELSNTQDTVKQLRKENGDLQETIDDYQDEIEHVENWSANLTRKFSELKNNLDKLERCTPAEAEFALGLVNDTVQEVLAVSEELTNEKDGAGSIQLSED